MKFLAVNLPAEPTIARSPSGVVVATLGSASDNADAELVGLLEAVDRELAESPAEIELASLAGPLEDQQIEAAPAWPTTRVPAPLIWGFHAGAVASVMTSATRRLALFQRMRRTVNRGQLVAMMAQPGPAEGEFVEIVRGLGIAIKTLGAQLVVHVEIERADGTKISAFGGRDHVARAPSSARCARSTTARSPRRCARSRSPNRSSSFARRGFARSSTRNRAPRSSHESSPRGESRCSRCATATACFSRG